MSICSAKEKNIQKVEKERKCCVVGPLILLIADYELHVVVYVNEMAFTHLGHSPTCKSDEEETARWNGRWRAEPEMMVSFWF